MPFPDDAESHKAVQKLTSAEMIQFLEKGPRIVWAVLSEDRYETLLGDGYYAYVEAAFEGEEDARRFASSQATDSWYRWHLRSYRLYLKRGSPAVSPEPTEAEPTTPATLIAHLLASEPSPEP
jgi:hypothetical protein